ncbi:DNA helicase [Salipiger sp. P9]|uniref:DNA helicase n=1 Tax=Salipiger pentaromativorans TaxID=2943193 RepID=UPI0021583278|nr:DNA helicase [Salipiger pentaromativorans]MCR8547401.1 DNA helicase [Salipiger pentaromativorans]
MRLSAPVHHLKRRARALSREARIPLHAALDRIARDEGFATWGPLASRLAADAPAGPLLARLSEGDLLLLGARPGQGKTLLGLALLLDALREGRRAVFFTLEYTEAETRARLRALEGGDSPFGARLEIVTSDEIDAAFIAGYLAEAPRGSVAIIDYLQILDQQRHKPALADQLRALRAFAHARGIVLGFLSQFDRRFDAAQAPLPGLRDIRLPNPVDLDLFSKACFLHAGELRFEHLH